MMTRLGASLFLVLFGFLGCSLATPIPRPFDYALHAFGKTYYGKHATAGFRYHGPHNHIGYELAEEYCKRIGAKLVKIRNQAEQTFFEQLGRSFWLGVNSKYSWDDGSEIAYSKWDADISSRTSFSVHKRMHDADDHTECVYYSAYRKEWKQESCQNSNDVICEVLTGKTSVKSPSRVLAEHKYKLFLEQTNKDFKEITDQLHRSSISAWHSRLGKENASQDPEIVELRAKKNAVRETLVEMQKQVLRVYNATQGINEIL